VFVSINSKKWPSSGFLRRILDEFDDRQLEEKRVTVDSQLDSSTTAKENYIISNVYQFVVKILLMLP